MANKYAEAGVDTAAGDLAVELMKAAVSRTHNSGVFGGFGGFAGLYDVSFLKTFDQPLLATSTDGVGTKVAIAQAIDKHDTIGQDLVGMVVDDIIVVGARPLFMTDYIACGKVVPERIADIVRGIAEACSATGTALVGGETAEHPGLLGPDDYDVAGAAVGFVEAADALGPEKVQNGDVVIAIASSGLHSNGFSLVRHILASRDIGYTDVSAELGGTVGEILLEPTRLYTGVLASVLDELPGAIHSLSHVTGGGIAANLARVLPQGSWVEVDRAACSAIWAAWPSRTAKAPGTSVSACSRWSRHPLPPVSCARSSRRGSRPGLPDASLSEPANSQGSSRARRASTAGPSSSSGHTPVE